MDLVNKCKNFLIKNSPQILTACGAIGVVGTAVASGRATLKANDILKQQREVTPDLTKKESLSVVWKCYIPPAVLAIASISCILGANGIHTKRNAALASLYSVSQIALSEYKNKVVETIGEKKEDAIKNEVAKDKIDKKPASKEVIFETGDGDTLCFDELSGRYFHSDIEKIRQGVNTFNECLNREKVLTLNALYDCIHLRRIEMGTICGWNIDDGLLEVTYSTQLSDDEEPCVVMLCQNLPDKLI